VDALVAMNKPFLKTKLTSLQSETVAAAGHVKTKLTSSRVRPTISDFKTKLTSLRE
jgi:hypothetical protein